MKDDGVDVTTDFPPDVVRAHPAFHWHGPEQTESFIKSAPRLDGHQATAAVVERS